MPRNIGEIIRPRIARDFDITSSWTQFAVCVFGPFNPGLTGPRWDAPEAHPPTSIVHLTRLTPLRHFLVLAGRFGGLGGFAEGRKPAIFGWAFWRWP